MTAAPILALRWKLHGGEEFASRTSHSCREAEVYREETGRSTGRSRRGTGPSTYARIAEITSGATNFQQGLATTCKDLEYKGNRKHREVLGEAHEPV